MAIDIFASLVVGLALGALAGATSAFLGWNKSGEPFDTKKFINGLVTGVISGVIAVMASSALITGAVDQTALLTAYVTIFIAIIGVDTVRTSVSGAVANRAVETQEEKQARI